MGFGDAEPGPVTGLTVRPRPRDEVAGPPGERGVPGRGIRGLAPGEAECPPGPAPGGFRGGLPPGLAPVRIRLDIGYDGTGFSGWARQPGRRTM